MLETYHIAEHSLVTKNWCFASNLAIPGCQERITVVQVPVTMSRYMMLLKVG